MVVVLVITICPETIFLIIARMAGDFLVGMDLFDVGGGVLVEDRRRRIVVAGAILLRSHDGQFGGWRRGKESLSARSKVSDQDEL